MDDNRIIIDSANFNRNMPKWASDDTLKRLERMIGNSHKQSQKSLKDVLSTLKTISNKESDLFKEVQKSNKEQKKELQKITKILASNNKTGGNTSNKNDDKVVAETKKTNTELQKGFKSVNSSSQRIIDSILDGNDDVERKLTEANKTSDQISNQLLKIYDELKNVTGGRNNNPSNGTNDRISQNNNNNTNNQTNSLLGDIKNILDRGNTLQSKIVEKTVSGEEFSKLMNNNARRITENYQDANRQNMGSLSSMLKNAIDSTRNNASGGSTTNKLIGGAIGSLTSVVTDLSRLLRTTPLGRLVGAGMMAYTAATKTYEYAYDVQSQFRDLIDRGFNFSGLSGDVGGERLDGISMRRAITRNDIGLETATQILEKNTRLINEMGFNTMFTELGNIIGGSDDPNSVTNRLGMTRDQVAIIATDFYAMHRRINSITKDFTSIDRQNLASQFIENVRGMSQQLGVGIPQVREAIEQFTKTERFSRTASFLAPEQSQNIAMLSGMVGNLDISETIREAMLQASTSVAGINDPAVMEAIGRSPLLMELFSGFSSEFSNMRNMDVDQQTSFIQEFGNRAIEILDRDGGATVEGLSIDATQRQAADALSSFRNVIEQLQRDPSELMMGGSDQVSPIAATARELENLGILIGARTEDLFASAADSREGRTAISSMLDIDTFMKEAQLTAIDLTEDIVTGLFDGPIPTILRQIKNLFERVADTVGWLSGRRHNDQIGGSDADKILNRIESSVLGKEGFDSLFNSETVDGKTMYNLKDGITDSNLQQFFNDMFQNSNSQEERELIAGSIKSLSRGIQGRDSGLDEDARSRFARIEENFLGMATNETSGDEQSRLLDVFGGFEDSITLFGDLIDSNAYSNNPGSFMGMGSSAVVNSTNVDRGISRDISSSLDRLNRTREINLQEENLRQEYKRRQDEINNDGSKFNTVNFSDRNRDAFSDSSLGLDMMRSRRDAQPTNISDMLRPERFSDNVDTKSILDELKRNTENERYSEQVQNASNSGNINEFTQNSQEDVTINNQQEDSNLTEILGRLENTQREMTASNERSARALERYLSTKV